MKLFSTKILTEEQRKLAGDKGILLQEKNFIEINFLVTEELAQKIAAPANIWVFTSANAVRAVVETISRYQLPKPKAFVYCLEPATLTEVIKNFFSVRESAKTAIELAEKIKASHIPSVTFFCGSRRRDELPSLLKFHGIDVKEIMVYETKLTPVEIDFTKTDGLLFFSPSAVESFLSGNMDGKNIPCFCIGPTTAAYASKKGFEKVICAAYPDFNSMLQLLEDYQHKND